MPTRGVFIEEQLAVGESAALHTYNMAEAVARPAENEWARVVEGRVAVLHDDRFHRIATAGDPIGFFRGDLGHVTLVAVEPSRIERFDYEMLLQDDPDEAAAMRALFLEEARDLRARRVRLEQGLADYLARPGARLLPGPYHSRDVRMDLFLVELDEPVEVPKHMARVFERRALMAVATFPCFGTADRVVRSFVYAEVALFIPVLHPARGPALYCPELRPDNLMALITGREMHGFPKRFARSVMADDDGFTLVVNNEVRTHLRFEREPLPADRWMRDIASALWPDSPIGKFSGAIGRTVTRLLGLDNLMLLAPRLPVLVRRKSPSQGGLPPVDELRGVPFRFDDVGRDGPAGLPRFASPRCFERLCELRTYRSSWYPSRVLDGWSLTLDLELGEARRLGLEGIFRQLVEELRGEPEWAPDRHLPLGLTPEPIQEGARIRLPTRARLDLESPLRLVEGRVALFEDDLLIDLVEAGTVLGIATPLSSPGQRRVEAIEEAVLEPFDDPVTASDALQARVRWAAADAGLLDRFGADSDRIYVQGTDAELSGGTVEGPRAIEIWALKGPPSPLEEGALPRVLRPLRRFLVVEEYETGRAGGLYVLCVHPSRGRLLVCVERWLDTPAHLVTARERLCQPARWGHFRTRPWTVSRPEYPAAAQELLLCLDGRLQLELRRRSGNRIPHLRGLMGLPIQGPRIPIASWWRVHGFRAGPPLRRVVVNHLTFDVDEAHWLRQPALVPLSGAWTGQSVTAAARLEGRSKWEPSEALPNPGRMRHPWRPRRHR